MTAPNHALTGALIGLSVSNPALALPLAFLSHFVLDVIPHYDIAELDDAERLKSKQFFYEYILLGAGLCFVIVLVLALKRPEHWPLAALCAFVATSADLFWLPRYLYIRRTGKDRQLNPFLRFHNDIQWKTGPNLWWVEALWFVGSATLLWHYL